MNPPALLLASASPRRASLLGLLEVPFRVAAPKVPEVAYGHLAPHEICLANAGSKARALAKLHPEALVLGADTEVALEARVFGKPRNRAEAAEFLRALSGQTHQVITGVCLLHAARKFRLSFAETSHVTFHPLTDRQIAAYLQGTDPLDKAGAYAIQDGGELIIEAIVGSLSNVVGLPVEALRRALAGLPKESRPALR